MSHRIGASDPQLPRATLGRGIELGLKTFPSKAIAKTYIRDKILRRYSLHESIEDQELRSVLFDVVYRKHDASEVVGPGVGHFFVANLGEFRHQDRGHEHTPTLAVHRSDGTDVDFDFEDAIDGERHVERVQAALRLAVEPLRDEFKASRLDEVVVRDDLTDFEVAVPGLTEVRYLAPSWGQLTAKFVNSIGAWDAIEIHGGDGDCRIGSHLVSDVVRDQWIDHYMRYAEPVLVSKR